MKKLIKKNERIDIMVMIMTMTMTMIMKVIIHDFSKECILFTFYVNMCLLFLYIYFIKNNINQIFKTNINL